MEGVKIDGNNLLEVFDTISGVRDFCINHQKPYLIECMTFRMRGHEEASGTKYVPKELFETWAEKDPIKNFEEYLLSQNVLTTEMVEATRSEIKEYIESELQVAYKASALVPETTEELNDVYAPGCKTGTAYAFRN
jgi:2-oxoisovalerate dehydrogenase E1 component